MAGRRIWTESEDAELDRLRLEGLTVPQIADRLGRSLSSIENHIILRADQGKPVPAPFGRELRPRRTNIDFRPANAVTDAEVAAARFPSRRRGLLELGGPIRDARDESSRGILTPRYERFTAPPADPLEELRDDVRRYIREWKSRERLDRERKERQAASKAAAHRECVKKWSRENRESVNAGRRSRYARKRQVQEVA